MNLLLFLILLIAGILFLVVGLFFTRLTWRSDVETYGQRSRLFQIALHPERYAKPDRLREIRLLNLIGGILLCGALMVVIYDIVLSVLQP